MNKRFAVASEKIASIQSTLGIINQLRSLTGDYYQKYRDKTNYIISVDDEDYNAFDEVLVWLQENTPNGRKFKMVGYGRPGLVYDKSGRTSVYIDGHKISVALDKPEKPAGAAVMEDYGLSLSTSLRDRLVFTCPSKDAAYAVEAFLADLIREKNKRPTIVYVYNLNGIVSWSGNLLPHRDLKNVVLPEGVKEGFFEDFEKFRNSEEKYNQIGFPYHFGVLLSGPPGNGKSSFAAGLAHQYKMSLYNLPLSGIDSDKRIAEVLAGIMPNSILLIEDIDIFSRSISREQSPDGRDGLTLAGLLNALDGVATPHGLVTIITTNHPEKLDEALIRAGRIDHTIELHEPTDWQVETLFENVYGEELGVDPAKFKAMANVAKIIKKNLHDIESARLGIKNGE